jgi:hypothetical protein
MDAFVSTNASKGGRGSHAGERRPLIYMIKKLVTTSKPNRTQVTRENLHDNKTRYNMIKQLVTQKSNECVKSKTSYNNECVLTFTNIKLGTGRRDPPQEAVLLGGSSSNSSSPVE